MTLTWLPLYLLALSFLLTGTAEAFQCYVCDSKNDIECMENWPPNSRLIPQDCHNITGAKYCIKTTNLYAGELGTKRFCAANDHGNYCKYIRQPTGDRDYRSCVLTCDSENCNGSSPLFGRKAVFYVLTPLTIFTNILMTIFTYDHHHHRIL